MSSVKVVGDTAYELLYKDDSPLTDAQAEALISEYAKLGLRYKKSKWDGYPCIIVKAPAAQYERFQDKLEECWQSIHEHVLVMAGV